MVEFTETLVILVTLVLPAVFALAKALLDVAFGWVKTKTPFYFLIPEDEVRQKVEKAIEFGVNYAVVKTKESGALTVKTDNKFIVTALEYVKDSIPLALKRFGITDERLADMVRARLVDIKV